MFLHYHPKLTKRIIEQTPRTISGLILVSLIFIWVYKEFIPVKLLSIWVLAQIIFIFLRYKNAKKLEQSIKNNDAKKTQWHIFVLLLLIIYSACLWSASTLLGVAYAPAYYEFVLLSMIIGIVTAGVLTLASFFHIYAVYFFIMTFVQLGILFYLGEHIHISAALLLMLFIPMIFLFSKSIYIDSLQAIETNVSLKRSVDELHNLSITDSLTDIYNRRHFFMMGEKMIKLSQRKHQQLALLMLDIDHFKMINDTYGHQAGDKILIELSQEINNITRKSDVFARVGGEEFALLLNDTSDHGAKRIAEKLCTLIENKEFIYKHVQIELTISIGLAMFDNEFSSLDGLYHEADLKLYKAKRLGRNQVCY
ncbi:MAG: GGDEF domain-containing protein [Pseudomonadota bacterium]